MRLLTVILLGIVFIGCATAPPGNPNSLCDIFEEKRGWHKDANYSFERWGVPIHVQMAIIFQESGYDSKARPPRKRFLGLIPTSRPSSAYGYTQALDSTWDWYIRDTGNRAADRDDFSDAVDFIGWYGTLSHRQAGISKWDAYNQYLAYHEGQGGFRRGSYKGKGWLINTARRVEANAQRYSGQLARCEDDIDDGWGLWPF